MNNKPITSLKDLELGKCYRARWRHTNQLIIFKIDLIVNDRFRHLTNYDIICQEVRVDCNENAYSAITVISDNTLLFEQLEDIKPISKTKYFIIIKALNKLKLLINRYGN